MKTQLGLLLVMITAPILLACKSSEPVPPPSSMQANIEVKGRLSKLVNMDIEHVGKNIPYTYSHNKIANSPGYEWWVSKHFAIKSDLPEHKVKLYLELLELSYPHYVSLFGAEPSNIDNQRIAVVYGSSRASTKETMQDDGFTRGVHKHAGGETMYYNRAGYSFPSHREQHQRYIVIHETMHAYHMALTEHSTWAPNWITEGLADSIASHVYYPDSHELAVMVFDRAPMNYLASGLKQYAEGGNPSIEQINNDPSLKRGLNFFIIHFLLSDPERAHYFALFRDRLMKANPHSSDTLPTAQKLLKETFPDWSKLESEFTEFVAQISPSFLIAKGPWEQNGNRYWIRSYNQDSHARLDIRAHSQDTHINQGSDSRAKHPITLDFPQPLPSALIDKRSKFIAGSKVDFVSEHLNRGQLGLAIGLNYHPSNSEYFNTYQGKFEPTLDSYLSIQLHQGRKVTIEGHNFPISLHSFALSQGLKASLEQELALGVSANLVDDSLVVTLKTKSQVQELTIELTPTALAQISKGHVALIANNNKHYLTPYLAEQPKNQDYFKKVDEKQWTSNTRLFRIFKTCLDYNLDCPSSLEQELLNASKSSQDSSERLERLENKVAQLAAGNSEALLSLSGLSFDLITHNDNLYLEVGVQEPVNSNVTSEYTWLKKGKQLEIFSQLRTVSQGRQQFSIRNNSEADELRVSHFIEWQGHKLEIKRSTPKPFFDGVYLSSNWRKQGDELEINVQLTGPYSGDTQGSLSLQLLPSLNEEQVQTVKVELQPYEKKNWRFAFKPIEEKSQNSAIEIKANLIVDGEGVALSEFIYLNKK